MRASVVVNEHGDATAGIAFASLDAPPAPRVVAAPFCDTCDPLFDGADEREALLASLVAHQRPILLRCLDVRLPPSDGFTVTKCARWHTLVLKGTEQEQWEAMDPATRRAVRKARREGVEIRPIAPGPGLAAFHRLHVALRKSKYRLLAQPLGFFEAIASRFAPANAWHALGAWIGDRLIAGTIYLRWGDTLYYKFNASAVDALDVRPNSLLTWAGIELATQLGCRRLDLGPSDDDQPGLVRFKRQFGADERELQFLRRDPTGWDDATAKAQMRLLGDITRRFTEPDVPDEVTAAAGAVMYRYFA